jgi:hypothetical protein
VSSPSISAFKYDYNPDTSLKSASQVNASGSTTGKPLSKVTVVAEPGTYTLDARAIVNGASTSFGGTTITFGAPAPTTTAGSPVVLMSQQDSGLQLDLTFASITRPGVSSMVESLLGPAPPAGIKAACDPNDAGEGLGLPCAPIYYDLRTTAQWGGLTKVCVRRRFSDDYFNAVTDFLQLWHFNEALPAGAQWEQLPPPPPPAGVDCAAEPDNAGCRAGFDCTADPSQCDSCPGEVSCEHVFRICGMTSSFSPVTVGLGTIEFSNTVGGHTYTGAGGPPALQRWTVPGDGVYRITATGATGGRPTTSTTLRGGCGA